LRRFRTWIQVLVFIAVMFFGLAKLIMPDRMDLFGWIFSPMSARMLGALEVVTALLIWSRQHERYMLAVIATIAAVGTVSAMIHPSPA